MAGAGAKLFTSGAVLTAAQVNTFLMDQAVMVFASTAARDAAFGGAGEPTVAEGMYAYTSDTNTLWFYTGSAWESAGATTQSLTLNAQTGTSYTLALTDSGKFVTQSNASAITTTVPPNSSVAFPIGTQVNLLQLGAGQVTVAAGAGVTIRSESSKLKLKGQYATATCVKIATDEWVLLGNTAA
jgi:hypothetical protein